MATADAFAEILPPAAASASTATKKMQYDVFINHRGPDTKHTVAASIYATLKTMGLEVFLDESELELGDFIPSEIQEAMKSAFLHIAIFSPRYAESPWCLAELSFMLNTGKPIIPVFYNVDPSKIHWICQGKGIYAQNFSEHETKARYSPGTLKDWKVALEKVSYIKGHIVENDNDKGMLKNIVSYVLEHPKKISFVVAEHPVGLDEILQDFERSLFKSWENVKIVGITGMGGCGKTTLAKEYYNKKKQSFYRCSFVCDVRDTPIKNFCKKQEKMFQEIGGSRYTSFSSVEEGKAILAEYLRSVQVFIILDDVDHVDQLNSLLPIKDNLKQGSMIVITSRNSDVLTAWGIPSDFIYKMKGLNTKHAMELFCWYAFRQISPIDEFEYLVKKFLEVCEGLPLSLKVLGRLVHGKKSKEYWDGELNKVSRVLPEDIKNILKVSFDALDKEAKEVFLDISCFFIGSETDSAITLWDGSGWSGVCSLVTLVNRCLVEVDGSNCIRMHDQLRDLGRQIAETWTPHRLWSPEQIDHIEEQGKKIVQIRGIRSETEEFCEDIIELVRGSNISKRRLEILDVENNYFTEELGTLAARLIWLRWVNFPHMSLPSWISLKKLRVLELREASKLEQLWSETADLPVELRVLKIMHAPNFLRFPRSIGFLKHLQKISFDGEGAPIEGLPEDFCRLQSLECLELVGCDKLKSLPSNFGDLTNLRRLLLKGCSGIEDLPEEFCRLQSLEYLMLDECDKLKSLPDKIGYLTNLQTLNIWGCDGLMIPSVTLAQLSSLFSLRINFCPALREWVIQPGCFSSSFSSLYFMEVSDCPVSRISISPQCCPTLEILVLGDNHDLVEIDSLPASVKEIYVVGCSKLESISLNCGPVELKKLRVVKCAELRKIEEAQNCRSLEILEAQSWRKVPLIQSLKGMENLWSVNLAAASHISAFETCLQTLNREEWPMECIICGRTAPRVESIANNVKSFTVLGLTLVDSFVRKEVGGQWWYAFSKELSSNEAAMICLVINSALDDITIAVDCVVPRHGSTCINQGKWVFVGIFRQPILVRREVSFWVWSNKLKVSLEDCVEKGVLVMGEEKRVVDAFYELVQGGKVSDV